jgi:RHS repeat-associated protein
VSKLGDLDSYGADPRRIEYAGEDVDKVSVDYVLKYKDTQQTVKDNYKDFKVPYLGLDNDDYVNGEGFCCTDKSSKMTTLDANIGNGNDDPEKLIFFYHSDHLGSTSYVTNLDGNVVQHVEYIPFGEVFLEEKNNVWNTPYLFNSKELDEETGLYYYGARYYNPRESVWLSVDPLAEKYPSYSPYAYALLNPVKFVDPDGEEPTPAEAAEMADHIYTGKVGNTVSGGWRLDKIYTSDKSSSFKAGVYSRTVDGVTEYAMANAGTYFEASKRGLRSITEDVKQVFGSSTDMALSLEYAKQVNKRVGSAAELTFVGHSKGGAEAAGNAIATNRNAILFNTAATNTFIKDLNGKLESYTGKMMAYYVKGDLLNSFLNPALGAGAIGSEIALPRQSWNPITNHLMESVFSGLKEYEQNIETQKINQESQRGQQGFSKWLNSNDY